MNVQGKRLLILGAGRGQVGLYKAAKEMGIHTIAGTMPDNNPPCIGLADEVCYMNIANPDDVYEKSKELNIDGVATCCLDTGIPALGKLCDSLGLTGLTEKSAEMCGDKLKMKKAFINYGVSTAEFYEIYSEADLINSLTKLSLPVIIKATDLQGSNGIYIARTEEEAFSGFRESMKKTKRNYLIVERFIEGWEFGAQAFVYNNEVVFVMPHADETCMCHTAVPIGHSVPLDADDAVITQTEKVVNDAIKALGLNNCAVNVDLILKDGKVYIIELSGRIGANCLPELVQIYFGIEYYKMVAAMALGESPLDLWNNRRTETKAGIARMIREQNQSGILESISFDGYNENIYEATFFKHPGDEIRIFENSNDCVGQIIVQGNTIKECKYEMDVAINKIHINLN